MATNMISSSKSNPVHDLRAAADDRVGLSRHNEPAGMNATLRILADSVGLFEQRASELVKQFADRSILIEYARTLEFADKLRFTEVLKTSSSFSDNRCTVHLEKSGHFVQRDAPESIVMAIEALLPKQTGMI